MNIRPTAPRPTNRAEALYSLLLWCYPPLFRRTYGTDMRLLFRDCLRDARHNGRNEVLTLWLSTLLDIVMSAPRAHLEEWMTMPASYTRASQWGAVFAVLATLLWIFTFAVGDIFVAYGNVVACFVLIALVLTIFGALSGLYVRLTAARPSRFALAGLICGVIGLIAGLVGCIGWLFSQDNNWSWVALMGAIGLLAFGFTLSGIAASGQRDLGPLRFAPLLPIAFTILVLSVLVLTPTAEQSMDVLSVLGFVVVCAGFAGTGILLWTHAK